MYIHFGMNGRDLAELFQVTEQTISRWKKEGEWDKRKDEISVTPGRIKEVLIREANKIAKGEKSEIDADKLSKIMASIEKLDKSVNIRVITDVLKRRDNWLAEIDPQRAIEDTKFNKMFLQHCISLEL